jgi:hypothetical protein
MNKCFVTWKVYGSNPGSWIFKFVKILTQIMNNFSRVQQKLKLKLIYAQMVKVLR